MSDPVSDGIKNLKQEQSLFRARFQMLRAAKNTLFKLFRQKLEAKKISEVKEDISNTYTG